MYRLSVARLAGSSRSFNPRRVRRCACRVVGITLSILSLLPLHGNAQEWHSGDLQITRAYTVATPPGAAMAGGYMVLRNTGRVEERLLGGRTGFSRGLEILQTSADSDVVRMRPLETALIIPAGGEVVLEPGGLHLMFTDLQTQLRVGESHPVELDFERAGTVTLDLPVTRPDHAGLQPERLNQSDELSEPQTSRLIDQPEEPGEPAALQGLPDPDDDTSELE